MQTLYMSIRDDLLAKIKDGTYAEGDTIPSEVDLAKAYGVSRPTVRQALQILVNDGYLDRHKRRGTIVSKATEEKSDEESPSMQGAQSFEEEKRREGGNVRTMPILVKEEPAGEEVAEQLGIPLGEAVYKLVRLRYINDTPNVFMENYVPARLYPGLIDGVDFSQVRLYERMKELGRPVHSLTRRIEVSKADASVSTLLDVPIGDPLFYFHTHGKDASGNIVEYSISTYRGRNNSFEFSVSEPDTSVEESWADDPLSNGEGPVQLRGGRD